MTEHCPTCGAKTVEYKHSLSKSLVRCLYVAAQEGSRSFNPNNLNLNYNQKSNFQKLRYWNLIAKLNQHNQKGGEWLVTSIGMEFLRGESLVRKHAWTFRGKVERLEGELINIQAITDGWKYRPQYAAEAVPH